MDPFHCEGWHRLHPPLLLLQMHFASYQSQPEVTGFHGFSLFHIMLFIYSGYGGLILICRCEVTSYISEIASLLYGLFREWV